MCACRRSGLCLSEQIARGFRKNRAFPAIGSGDAEATAGAARSDHLAAARLSQRHGGIAPSGGHRYPRSEHLSSLEEMSWGGCRPRRPHRRDRGSADHRKTSFESPRLSRRPARSRALGTREETRMCSSCVWAPSPHSPRPSSVGMPSAPVKLPSLPPPKLP